MLDLPKVSSGANWTSEEDERLYHEFEALVAKFEGRSFAAVMTRVALWADNGAWWARRRDEHREGRVGR